MLMLSPTYFFVFSITLKTGVFTGTLYGGIRKQVPVTGVCRRLSGKPAFSRPSLDSNRC